MDKLDDSEEAYQKNNGLTDMNGIFIIITFSKKAMKRESRYWMRYREFREMGRNTPEDIEKRLGAAHRLSGTHMKEFVAETAMGAPITAQEYRYCVHTAFYSAVMFLCKYFQRLVS